MKNPLVSLPLIFVLMSLAGEAQALVIPINCGGKLVGNISVFAGVNTAGTQVGVSGSFASNPVLFPTIGQAAAQCAEDHFNWYQVVMSDNHPPLNVGGHALTPPYVDPPPGGTGGVVPQWHDSLPWYWDEGADPPSGTPGFDDTNNVLDRTNTVELKFLDSPSGVDGTKVEFNTWLVSVNKDGSFHEFHSGFKWTYDDPLGPIKPSITNLILASGEPTGAEFQDIVGEFATHVPEPGTLALVVAALVALVSRQRLRVAEAAAKSV